MDNGIYAALSRQVGLFRDMAITAENLANVNTTGYGAQHLLFQSYLVQDGSRDKVAYAQDVSSYRSLEGGGIQPTGNPLDVALEGKGYFSVETPLGTRYTRAGNFQLDGNGVLTTAQGYPVLDDAGQRITFEETDREIKIGELGNITVDGTERSSIGVFSFSNENLLEAAGNQLYKTDVKPETPETFRVAQGMLETSNVKPVIEMVHMIDVSRTAGATAKYIETIYDLQRKTGTALTQQS